MVRWKTNIKQSTFQHFHGAKQLESLGDANLDGSYYCYIGAVYQRHSLWQAPDTNYCQWFLLLLRFASLVPPRISYNLLIWSKCEPSRVGPLFPIAPAPPPRSGMALTGCTDNRQAGQWTSADNKCAWRKVAGQHSRVLTWPDCTEPAMAVGDDDDDDNDDDRRRWLRSMAVGLFGLALGLPLISYLLFINNPFLSHILQSFRLTRFAAG